MSDDDLKNYSNDLQQKSLDTDINDLIALNNKLIDEKIEVECEKNDSDSDDSDSNDGWDNHEEIKERDGPGPTGFLDDIKALGKNKTAKAAVPISLMAQIRAAKKNPAKATPSLQELQEK